MDPVSSLPAIASLLLAIGTSSLVARFFGPPSAQGRFASIDGLRGYLAFFVFLHHGSIWYYYLRTGRWAVPPSNLYVHFGQSSVALFFMITGFLFFSKLLDAGRRGVDWGGLFVARFLRLAPLYLFAVTLLFVIVAVLSDGVLVDTPARLATSVLRWLAFTAFGAPNLNGVPDTFTIMAGATWSLPYEWLFYGSLPLLALGVRIIPPVPCVVLGVASMAALAAMGPQGHHLLAFTGGIAAALAVRSQAFRRVAARRRSSLLAILCVAVAVAAYPNAEGAGPLALLAIAFALVAGGNSLFGALMSPASRTLGEMAYGIYLLHGLLLFTLFTFAVETEARDLSAGLHWMLVIGLSPVLVLASFCAYRLIERPAMHSTPAVVAWLRARRGRGRGQPAAGGSR